MYIEVCCVSLCLSETIKHQNDWKMFFFFFLIPLNNKYTEYNYIFNTCPLFDRSLKGKDFLDFLNAYTTLNKDIFSKYACSVRKLWQLRSVVDIIIFIKQISWFMGLLFHRYVWPHYLLVAVPNIIYYKKF